jgi:hydrogenase nickel incorporation protein HypA/HybF
MHELGVTEEMLSLVVREAQAHGASRVTAVNLLLGEFSTIVEESVRFYWDFLCRGTIAEGADLHFTIVPAAARCRACGNSYRPDARDERCPVCGEALPMLIQGDEFRVESIDID